MDFDFKQQSAVTLAEVAEAAGVGESTVSRVLRNEGSFSRKARERVLEAVERLGYVPNRIAGTLASAGSRLVAFVIPSLSNIVFPDVLRGASGVLEKNKHQAVFSVTDYDPQREEALVAAMLAWRPTAVMLAGFEHTEGTLKMLRASGCRVVEVLDVDGAAVDLAVGFSNRAAGRASAEFLLKRGYRRIGYVGHDLDRDTRAGKRFAGFRETLAASRLSTSRSGDLLRRVVGGEWATGPGATARQICRSRRGLFFERRHGARGLLSLPVTRDFDPRATGDLRLQRPRYRPGNAAAAVDHAFDCSPPRSSVASIRRFDSHPSRCDGAIGGGACRHQRAAPGGRSRLRTGRRRNRLN
ncbi:DNA-binding LacI/PurR family transcriptional regulator [Sinorhizobium fredii]